MKKSLIAGASALALGVAVVPAAGVFAAVSPVEVKDTITLTVNEACTFSTGGTAIAPNATIDAGASTTFGDNGTHEFVVKCNSKAYSVTAQATNLTNSGATSHGTITYVANANYDEDVEAIGADGEWTAVLTGGSTGAAIATSSSTIKSGNSTDTDNFSVAYKAFAGTAQNQGTYTGTVTYTLTGSND